MPVSATLLNEYLRTFPEATLTKGERIFKKSAASEDAGSVSTRYHQIIKIEDEGPRSISLMMPSEGYYYGYDVKMSWSSKGIRGRCGCAAFEEFGPCKHLAGAALYLLNEIGGEMTIPDERQDPVTDTVVEAAAPAARRLFDKIKVKSSPADIFRAIDYRITYNNLQPHELKKITATDFDTEECSWNFDYQVSPRQYFHPQIQYDQQETFRLSCSCTPDPGLCQHLFTAACFLNSTKGSQYFVQFRNYDREKAGVLAALGLQPGDKEAAAVQFFTDYRGQLQYQLPEWLWPANKVDVQIGKLQQQLGLYAGPATTSLEEVPGGQFVPAVVFQLTTAALPFSFELSIVNAAGGKMSKLSTANEQRLPELKPTVPAEVFTSLVRISQPQLNRELERAGVYQSLPGLAKQLSPGNRGYELLHASYRQELRRLWPWLSGGSVEVFTSEDSRVSAATRSNPVTLHSQPVKGSIYMLPTGRFIELRLQFVEANGGAVVEGDPQPFAGMLLKDGSTWYLPADDATIQLMRQFPAGYIRLPESAIGQVYSRLLPSLRAAYTVTLHPEMQPTQISLPPEPVLHLREQGNKSLVLVPRFGYTGQTVNYEVETTPMLVEGAGGRWQEIVRDPTAEAEFMSSIRALHPQFADSKSLQTFSIPFGEALRESWYQKMLAQMAERGIPVTGIGQLQHFRYNTNEAKVAISQVEKEDGSSIDWFDLLIEISFGGQQVSLKEVRKALMQGQAGVRLADGTIGLLPEEFVNEYGALLKLGTEKNGRLQVNKLHFTLIDSLHEAALSKDLREEIAARKEALRNIENARTAAVPLSLKATLRPYQTAGYQWLQLLDQMGWGGCLADDMGLGKTLQTIAFLQYLQEQDGSRVSLVVCPTSLIFNWQAELEKFAPVLRYHIHYGAGRGWDEAAVKGADVVITSYGLMRTDLEKLMKVSWYCVILDESQAIKNPTAQTTKAVQLLPAKFRICLSGTPLQNNTFDLYAQFQFLNPGLLGSQDFFRTEFANPIDKHSEEGPRSSLRKMLAPFMLRRTKEQVAKDLPDKTEAILWCEMEPAQRAVYDEYRNFYRDSLLRRIDTEGMAGSSIYVLEALLRLRQLCDHPALVKNEAVKTSASIKLEELRREIRENVGGRKVLVFSQFTEMLGIIAADFHANGIAFAYLDGQTPAKKRKEAVDTFQTDPSVQVFLISLKAGGVGLNLTAAEYVYIVDPWWNPAAEAQAIDRTHRIGQTNKIVAYRMICKDTIEEKVVQLQSRKRSLADGLVTEDAGFVKKLTREDVAYLLEG